MPKENRLEMLDLHDVNVEVLISGENTVWVNIDGVCAVRVQAPKSITINHNGKDQLMDSYKKELTP